MTEPSNFYARSFLNSLNKNQWQPLADHLNGVADLAEKFAKSFDSAEFGRLAALLHDVGKAAPEFQKYLEESTKNAANGSNVRLRCSVKHSEAGAAFVRREFRSLAAKGAGVWGNLFGYLIAGHHAGLPDWQKVGSPKQSLINRLESGDENLEQIRERLASLTTEAETTILKLAENQLLPPESVFFQKNDAAGSFPFWIRMLFSCLVDADRLDSEAFEQPKVAGGRGKFASLSELKERFDRFMRKFDSAVDRANDEAERTLQQARTDVLNACRTVGRDDGESRRFTLTVPTGGGKTLASMAFALEHAVRWNKSRIIYAIPFTSVVEQTADVFREIFGKENVLEHHSNFDADKLAPTPDDSDDPDDSADSFKKKLELAAENWDAPIIITTNVQFFESLYAAAPKRCRKIHRIADSVVILDEAQSLPTEFLAPCVDVLNRLTESYRTTLVLSTATQPTLTLLKSLRDGDAGKTPNLLPTRPIYSTTDKLYQTLRRVRYEFDDPNAPRTWEEIADELEKFDEVLCVVNSRRDCLDLYNELAARERRRRESKIDDEAFDGKKAAKESVSGTGTTGESETIPLSALMCGEHRSRVIRRIRERLAENRAAAVKRPLRVVSTQLVEAGVDLDFPVVFRAFAGLDSIAQAAGRCNREGRGGSEGGTVRVFVPPTPPPVGLLRKGADATKELQAAAKSFDPQNPDSFSDYFKLFYSKANDLDKKDILKRLTSNVRNREGVLIPFRSVAEDFHLIDDDYSQPIYVLFGESASLIERLRREGIRRDLMRPLQRFSVNIPKIDIIRLADDGILEEIYPGIFVQTFSGAYDAVCGFVVDYYKKPSADWAIQ